MSIRDIKLMIVGNARHGKDYAAEIICKELGIEYKSSSRVAIDKFLYEKLKHLGFSSPDDLFNRRHEVRGLLYKEICNINSGRLTALAEAIFEESRIYVGIRNKDELEAAKKKWPNLLVVWIDASERMPPESEESCTVKKEQADIIIENNGSIEEFNEKVRKFCLLCV